MEFYHSPTQIILGEFMQKDIVKARNLKILVVGSSYVGKTSLITRFCTGEYDKKYTQSIVGTECQQKTIEIFNKKGNLTIYEFAAQGSLLNSIPDASYRTADGIIFIYSILDEKSFLHIQDSIIRMKELASKKPKNTAMVLVASKCDSTCNPADIQVQRKEGMKLAGKHHMEFFETSAEEGYHVDKPFYAVASDYLEDKTSNQTFDVEASQNVRLNRKNKKNWQNRPKKPFCFSFCGEEGRCWK